MSTTLILWLVFATIVAIVLSLDLFVINKETHTISVKESLKWTFIWVSISLLFAAGIFYTLGAEKGTQFITGYLLEYSLSVDNLFVIYLILSFFATPEKYQHRVIFWGILVAIIARVTFILGGVALVNSFHWVIYIFGAILLYTGIHMAVKKDDDEIHPEKNKVIRIFKKIFPVTSEYHGHNFFVKKKKKCFATPLFIALLMVETTDIVFAVDSIPAIISISKDPFIVITSNIFAIMGLRSLFFALSGIISLFRFLKYGLSFILVFIGFKMVISEVVHIPTLIALSVVLCTLTISIVLSVVVKEKK